MTQKNTIIHSLTSLRMFAALGVFVSHLGILSQSSIPQFNIASKYFFNGYVGVTFFYILSGFIINYSFSKHMAEGKFSNKDFIIYRLARLFPVHIVSLLFVLFLFGYTKNFDSTNKEALLYNTLLLQSFIPSSDYYFSFNPVSWSISCEIFFYLSFCILVKFKSIALSCILLLVTIVNSYLLIKPPMNLSLHWLFYINPFFRLGDFIIGMLICRWFLNSMLKPSFSLCSLMEILSVLFLSATVYVATNHVSYMNVKYDLFYIPCMAMMVISFAFNGGLISNILSNKVMVLLGEASFSFYMFHWMIISKAVEVFNPDRNNVFEVLLYILLCLSLAIAISIISFKLIEMPANKFIRNEWKKFRARRNEKEKVA